jgi:hypothetical protein
MGESMLPTLRGSVNFHIFEKLGLKVNNWSFSKDLSLQLFGSEVLAALPAFLARTFFGKVYGITITLLSLILK